MIHCAWALAAALGITIPPPSDGPPDPAAPSYFESTDVVSSDLLVELDTSLFREWLTGSALPANLSTGDLELTLGGVAFPIDAVTTEIEEWQIVIYFDFELADPSDITFAASLLAEQSRELTDLGRIQIFVADPEPRQLADSRDSAIVSGVFSQLALESPRQHSAHQLLLARDRFANRAQSKDKDSRDPAAHRALEDEQLFLSHRLDQLLIHLGLSSRTTAKALFLVTGGWDLDPAEYFSQPTRRADTETSSTTDVDPTDELGRSLAALGWTTYSLLAPEPVLLLPGKRIGKWRFMGLPPIAVGGTRESERDPKLARAHFELARSHRDSGRLREALENYEQAIHHFYRDPRTAEQQAQCYLELGDLLRELGDEANARRAHVRARSLDPALEVGAVLVNPTAALRLLSRHTAGGLLRRSDDVTAALESLRRRIIVAHRLPTDSAALGQSLPVTSIRRRGHSEPLRAPSWTSSPRPPGIGNSRARQLFSLAEVEGGFLDFDWSVTVEADQRAIAIELPDTDDFPASARRHFRVTVAAGSLGNSPDMTQELISVDHGHHTFTALIGTAEWTVVLVESLSDRDDYDWGAVVIED